MTIDDLCHSHVFGHVPCRFLQACRLVCAMCEMLPTSLPDDMWCPFLAHLICIVNLQFFSIRRSSSFFHFCLQVLFASVLLVLDKSVILDSIWSVGTASETFHQSGCSFHQWRVFFKRVIKKGVACSQAAEFMSLFLSHLGIHTFTHFLP